jgi:predicted dehydrogenase
MMDNFPIGVIGAGLIGRAHIDRALKQAGVELVGVADPSDAGRRLAHSKA